MSRSNVENRRFIGPFLIILCWKFANGNRFLHKENHTLKKHAEREKKIGKTDSRTQIQFTALMALEQKTTKRNGRGFRSVVSSYLNNYRSVRLSWFNRKYSRWASKLKVSDLYRRWKRQSSLIDNRTRRCTWNSSTNRRFVTYKTILL